MPLDFETTKRLMRLQSSAEELLRSARDTRGKPQTRAGISHAMGALIDEVRATLDDTDAELAAEFRRVVADVEVGSAARVEARAAALVGWLAGAVNAEAFARRIEAEARAYAEARVREERRIGFGPSDADTG